MIDGHATRVDVDQPLRAGVQESVSRSAIGVTLHLPGSLHKDQRISNARAILMRRLIALRDAERIETLLPFRHRPLKPLGENGSRLWTEYWVLVLATDIDPVGVWNSIAESVREVTDSLHGELLRVELLRPQPNLQMYFPDIGGLENERRLWHWIEYVVSQPETRDAYYQDQYKFSAPVIGQFYAAGAVGRCIGFERVRLLETDDTLPQWDVIHITGVMRFARVASVLLRQKQFFDHLARSIGHASALDVVRSWATQRVKYQAHAIQQTCYTLQPVDHSVLIPRTRGKSRPRDSGPSQTT